MVQHNQNHHKWKGDKVGYVALHQWIKKNKPKSNVCERCKKIVPTQLSNISGKYLRDIDDYRWLCSRCHLIIDGIIENLLKINPSIKHLKGTKHWKCKLNELEVLEIRIMATDSEITHRRRLVDIGQRFGISKSHVSAIKNRTSWTWL